MEDIKFELPGDCPSGEECPVHFRLDREQESDGFYSAVSYIGDYAIITGENPDVNPLELLAAILGGKMPKDLFVTSIFKVGKGTLYDLATANGDKLKAERNVPSGDPEVAKGVHRIAEGWANRQ